MFVRCIFFEFVFFFYVRDVSLYFVKVWSERLDHFRRPCNKSEQRSVVRRHEHREVVLGMDSKMVTAVDRQLDPTDALLLSCLVTQHIELQLVGPSLPHR